MGELDHRGGHCVGAGSDARTSGPGRTRGGAVHSTGDRSASLEESRLGIGIIAAMRSTLAAMILVVVGVSLLGLATLNVAQLRAATVIQNTVGPFQVVALERAKVRSGPGTIYDEVDWLASGASAPAIG